MPFPLSPQAIDALADIITGGPGLDCGPPPVGLYRTGPQIEKFMRACNVAFSVSGSRVPSLVARLIEINNGYEPEKVLPRIIEAAADPRDFPTIRHVMPPCSTTSIGCSAMTDSSFSSRDFESALW